MALSGYAHEHYDLKEDLWNRFRYLNKKHLSHIKMISGHGVQYGTHRYIDWPCQYVALIREPVDRVISQYYAYMTDPKYALHKNFVEQKLTLEEFSRRNPNMQIKQLLGGEYYFKDQLADWAVEDTFNFLSKHYPILGTTKTLFEFLHVLGKHIGIEEYPLVGKGRVNKKRKMVDEVPAKVREAIKSHNKLDGILYEVAKKKIDLDFNALSTAEQQAARNHEFRTKLYHQNFKSINHELFDLKALQRLLFHGEIDVVAISIARLVKIDKQDIENFAHAFNGLKHTKINILKTDILSGSPLEELKIPDTTISLIKKSKCKIVIFTDPSEDFIVKDALKANGIKEKDMCFLLNAIPSF